MQGDITKQHSEKVVDCIALAFSGGLIKLLLGQNLQRVWRGFSINNYTYGQESWKEGEPHFQTMKLLLHVVHPAE